MDMTETLQTNYESIPDTEQGVVTVSWKKFYVHLAGKTNNAHKAIVDMLKANGQTEVLSDEESDYLLVFCPIVSRVGTDISEALDNIAGDKPVILVVMHHTFNRDHVVAESRRLVNNPNVHLTVDCLFHNGKLLKSNRNAFAFLELLKILGFSASQTKTNNCFKKFWKVIALFAVVVVLVAVVAVIAVEGIKD